MNKYESIYILRPTMEEEAIKAMVEKFTNLITAEGGQVENVEEWGKRKLAYPIQKFREGYYVQMNFSAGPELPRELERNYRITDDVIRYIIVRDDD